MPAQLAPGVDEDRTTLVIIQNGVGNEGPFRARFPKTTIISCVVCTSPFTMSLCLYDADSILSAQTWTGAIQAELGKFRHTKSEDMQIGLFSNENGDQSADTQRLNEFAGLLTTGKTVFQIVPNIQVQRWEKVVWNVAWNSLTTLTLLDTHSWLKSSPGADPMTRRLMAEVINVAQKCGVPIEHSLTDRLVEKILGMPPIGSSMQNDFKANKPMEVDIILGYPVEKGLELGVPIPTLETIYLILKGANLRILRDNGLA